MTWTTAEFLVAEGDDATKNKVAVFQRRMQRKAIEHAIASLQKLL